MNKYSIEKYKESAQKYVYKKAGNDNLKLYVHMPKNITKNVPAVLYIHGGGWVEMQPEDDYSIWGGTVDLLNQAGIAFVNVEYRLCSEKNHYPNFILDCMDAAAWIASDPENIGLDSNRMAVMGTSAGGHLSLLTAFAQDAFKDYSRKPYIIRAVVDTCGPTDLCSPCLSQVLYDVLNNVLEGSYEQNPWLYKEFSPIYYLDNVKEPPAVLIIHGDKDVLVPLEQSLHLKTEAEARGWDVRLHILHDTGHDLVPLCDDTIQYYSNITEVTVEFLKQQLLK